MLSRRGLLVGACAVVAAGVAGGVGVEEGVLPGRLTVVKALGGCDVDAPVPDAAPGPLERATFRSARRGRDVEWTLALPPGHPAEALPVALVLHGRGDDDRTAFDVLGLHRFLAAHAAAGGPPFALAAASGGQGYWHPRADGDDPLGMLVDELLPRLRRRGLRTERIGVLGWSMGGYGALLLARQSGRDALGGRQVVAAAAASPALFRSAADTVAGAFDDAADFARWGDLTHRPEVPAGTALMVACGTDDPFAEATRAYRAAVTPEPAGGLGRGCHTAGYWRSQAAAQLAFLGGHLV
ncbi:MAG: alpha/beta hydrolase-fold protein [Motilibacteraceae bacterium]